jgi:transaldolase
MTMTATYFQQLRARTPTRVWVNNPTAAEIDLALEQGAVGSTTNPAFGGNLLRRAPDEIVPIIAACVRESDDDGVVADEVQRRLVARIADRFRPLHDETEGRLGFVSIQGAPEADHSAALILAEARDGHAVAPNVAPKLPATAPGLEAFEVLVEEGCPTIVTEVFSLDQLVETAERYLRAARRGGARPPFFISPITGILGDHLKALAARDGLSVPAADMELAGVALSRACLRLVEEREYPVTLLAGGARIPLDLTGLVGGDLHATINWSTFAQVLADPAPFAPGIADELDADALARVDATFGDYRRGMRIGSLTIDEFEDFGPVQHFRNNFVAGWNAVKEAITAERARAIAV